MDLLDYEEKELVSEAGGLRPFPLAIMVSDGDRKAGVTLWGAFATAPTTKIDLGTTPSKDLEVPQSIPAVARQVERLVGSTIWKQAGCFLHAIYSRLLLFLICR
jgi:hypothetical protein